MPFLEFIQHYGLIFVFFGAIFEGEVIVILAGFAAQQGYFSFTSVLVTSALGSFLGYQTFFYLGRFYGTDLISRFPKLKEKIWEFNLLFQRYKFYALFLSRFIYGFRNISAMVIGQATISAFSFTAMNLIISFIWAFLLTLLGYYSSHGVNLLLEDFQRFEKLMLVALILFVFTFYRVVSFLTKSKPKK